MTELAELYRWKWAHFRAARTLHGWRTPVAGPLGAGFPDLVLVRERLILAELKTERGALAPEQDAALAALGGAGVEAFVWRPSDFDRVHEVLRLFAPAPGPVGSDGR